MILKSKKKNDQHEGPVSLKNLDIDETVVSNEVLFGKKGFKYFIGYKDAKKIKILCIFLPKITAYRIGFDDSKYTSFLIKDDELLEKM